MTRSRYVIVQLQGAWTYVGRLVDRTETDLTIGPATILRRWGADKGLGQLVKGPLPDTIHWPVPTQVTIPLANVRFWIDAGGEWETVLTEVGRGFDD